ncbi:hypothetical protein LL033_09280 [Clostridium estertheticum]|uniref:DUF7922 domain-containing protein n=1 Tax=Clostridium estertheticum TaxID=238834 RepID=UPI001C0D4DCA|nr:hypothetical protein [Clostridium estertheticum]MBU3214859.1 hypothetical protein [Clostridium estertheticum]WAG57399.1 hypothetical protein LL033_09280 [Clostridium estertheticum]
MTPKKNYSRYFIILQEDEKGYSLESDKIPSGYAKLEMKNNKCKISYYVQNLRKEKQPYYMILICGKKDVNKIIKVGKLNIDDHGRVDIFHEYDMDNIADTGINAEKIIGAAIVKFLDNNVISIMSGFSTTEKPNEWKSYKLADSNKETKETRTDEVKNEFDEYEESIEIIKVKSDEALKHLEVQEKIDKKVEEKKVDVVEEPKVDTKQRIKFNDGLPLEEQNNIEVEEVEEKVEINQIDNICDCEISEKLEEKNEIDNLEDIVDLNRDKDKMQCKEDKKQKDCGCNNKENNSYKGEYPKGDMGNFFKAAVQDFTQVPDFTKEIKWCKWYKVPVHNLENMYDLSDYNKYTIAYYPMICYYPYIRNYKSFMLGYKCDSSGKMKYIVYGIPGSKNKAHQPYGGRTGFVTWIADKGNDEMGHWLMFYDFKNSTVVVPIKK